MRRRNGDTLVEMMIAFVILMFAVSITMLNASWIVGIEKKAEIKSDIYDVSYSYAEECVSKKPSEFTGKEVTVNGFTYSGTCVKHTNSIQGFDSVAIYMATLTVELVDERNQFDDEDFRVEMVIVPKQD